MNLYELLTANDVVEYWINKELNRVPLVGETLFPLTKEIGTELSWIKGAKGKVVGLRLSAYDAKAIKRDRQGIKQYKTIMPFFKEKMTIDEALRQQLNIIMQTNNQKLVNNILSKIFDDIITLIQSAYNKLEIMRMQMLTTGTITLSENGQSYSYDYGMPSANKMTATTSWSTATADISGDIIAMKEQAKINGYTLTRAMCNSSVIKSMCQNTAFKNAIYLFAGGTVNILPQTVISYISSVYGINIYVNDDSYVTEEGIVTKYIPDDTFVAFPDGNLGETHLGVTPEESDLMTSQVANVSLVDNAIAVTTSPLVDPVNVDTKISMAALPSFEAADGVIIFDVVAS